MPVARRRPIGAESLTDSNDATDGPVAGEILAERRIALPGNDLGKQAPNLPWLAMSRLVNHATQLGVAF